MCLFLICWSLKIFKASCLELKASMKVIPKHKNRNWFDTKQSNVFVETENLLHGTSLQLILLTQMEHVNLMKKLVKEPTLVELLLWCIFYSSWNSDNWPVHLIQPLKLWSARVALFSTLNQFARINIREVRNWAYNICEREIKMKQT